MYDFNFASVSEACRSAEWRRYNAECRIRCLEAGLERIDPDDLGTFERTMKQLSAAQEDLAAAVREIVDLRWRQGNRMQAHGEENDQ